MNEPMNAKVARQAQRKTKEQKVNAFDNPATTTSPQKQDTGIGLPAYLPKGVSKGLTKQIGKLYPGDLDKQKQVAKNMFTKPDARIYNQ